MVKISTIMVIIMVYIFHNILRELWINFTTVTQSAAIGKRGVQEVRSRHCGNIFSEITASAYVILRDDEVTITFAYNNYTNTIRLI